LTPLQIAQQLAELTQENNRGADALYAAEVELAEAENRLDLIEQRAFIKAQGTIADRTALARLEAADARLERDLAKAKANRVRVKIKALETSIMATATQAKLIQSEMKL
jgi:NADPH-dependent 7-cyano-7-deazaguanine reductase QueF-like protein